MSRRLDRAEWFALRAQFIAECARLRLPPLTTLGRLIGVSRQRAHSLLKRDEPGRSAIAPVRRWLEMARHVKPKPTKAEIQADQRAERERRRISIEDRERLLATVADMTSAWGAKTAAAREMGISKMTLSNYLGGRAYLGPVAYDRLTRWVERHSQ